MASHYIFAPPAESTTRWATSRSCSYVPADVVLDPAHARALRLARAARRRLEDKDVAMPTVNLAR